MSKEQFGNVVSKLQLCAIAIDISFLCFVVSLSDLQHVLKRKFAKCDRDWLTTSIAVITFDAVVRRSWS